MCGVCGVYGVGCNDDRAMRGGEGSRGVWCVVWGVWCVVKKVAVVEVVVTVVDAAAPVGGTYTQVRTIPRYVRIAPVSAEIEVYEASGAW